MKLRLLVGPSDRTSLHAWYLAAFASSILVASACQSDDSVLRENTVRFDEQQIDGVLLHAADSAGVSIVRNVSARSEAKRVVAPALRIGAVDDPETALSQVRSVVVTPQSQIVVANSGMTEILAFSLDGDLLWRQGRAGEGPGEYQAISDLRICGDHLVAVELIGRRLTFLDHHGNLRHTRPYSGARSDVTPLSFDCDGDTYIQVDREIGATNRPEGFYTVNAVISVGDVVSGDGRIVFDAPAIDRYRHETTDGPADFGRRIHAAIAQGLVHVVVGDEPEIRSYDSDGNLVRVVGLPVETQRITPQFLADEVERRVQVLPPHMRAGYRQHWRELTFPSNLPVIDDLIIDAAGNLWLREFVLPGDRQSPRSWLTVSPNGALLDLVEVPDGFDIFYAGSDWVIGTIRDSLGVEYVELRYLR